MTIRTAVASGVGKVSSEAAAVASWLLVEVVAVGDGSAGAIVVGVVVV